MAIVEYYINSVFVRSGEGKLKRWDCMEKLNDNSNTQSQERSVPLLWVRNIKMYGVKGISTTTWTRIGKKREQKEMDQSNSLQC
jgi:hypothetical protein